MRLLSFFPILFLNIIIVLVYWYVSSNIGVELKFSTMFATNDAITYRDVSRWITEGIATENTSIRPILYPLILAFGSKLCGVSGIWFLQFLLWCFSINLTFSGIYRVTSSYFWASIGALIIVCNFSLIALTYHALTEVTTVFLLSLAIYLCFKNRAKFRSAAFFNSLLLILVLLTLVKPVFYIPLLLTLFLILPFFYFKSIFYFKRRVAELFLILLPLIFQLFLVKVKHDKFTVSTIGEKTLNEYLIAQTIQSTSKIDRDSSLQILHKMKSHEKSEFLKKNLPAVVNQFKSNLIGNIQSAPVYLISFVNAPNSKWIKYMVNMNIRYYNWHLIFGFIFVPFLVLMYFKKKFSELFICLFFGLLLCYYLLATGISFWQGDRLTIGALGLFPFLYVYISYEFFNSLTTLLKLKFSSPNKKNSH